jgi:hypothetical protein
MIFSQQQLFSAAQLITATALSTNIIDLGVAATPFKGAAALHNDKGKGTVVPILIQCVADFNTLTSLTVTIEVSPNADMSASTVLATEVILLAALVAGKQTFVQVLPTGADKRYLAVRYTVGGTDPTLGAMTAGVTMGNQTNVTGA